MGGEGGCNLHKIPIFCSVPTATNAVVCVCVCVGGGGGLTYTTYLIICSVPTATIVQMLLAFFTERISPRDCGLPSKVLPVGLHLQASQP